MTASAPAVAAAIQIIAGATPGLRNDARIIAKALGEAQRTTVHVSRGSNLHLPWRRAKLGLRRLTGTAVAGIFLENIPTPWLKLMDKAVLVPNQEWLRAETLANLPRCDQVWCKTRYAQVQFDNHGFKTRLIGFTSLDRYLPSIDKDYTQFLHVAGRSELKGTETILRLWAQHPEWPLLTLVTAHEGFMKTRLPNLRLQSSFLGEDQLATLMNGIGMHLCTSETEGFGHYLNEAMSTSGLVVTTDAPPMNELARPEFADLVAYSQTSQQGWSERFRVDAAQLDARINTLVHMPTVEKARRGELARQVFLERDKAFQRDLRAAAEALLAG